MGQQQTVSDGRRMEGYEEAPPAVPGSLMHLTEHRGISLVQLRDLRSELKRLADKEGRLHDWVDRDSSICKVETVNLYDVVKYFVEPATSEKKCSYVELVVPAGTCAQTPKWFVSHWWGEPVLDFIACVEGHARLRELDYDEAVYWVCAYANNQHNLGADITADPKESAFFKAMQMCDGVLVVIDCNATVFTRIWCSFEQATVVQGKTLLLDFATIREGDVQILTQGFVKSDREYPEVKAIRESHFPLELMERGYAIDITAAQASMAEDKRHILNALDGKDLEAEPDLVSPALKRINATLRCIIAEHAAFASMQACRLEETILCVETAGLDPKEIFTFLRRISLILYNMSMLTDEGANPLHRRALDCEFRPRRWVARRNALKLGCSDDDSDSDPDL